MKSIQIAIIQEILRPDTNRTYIGFLQIKHEYPSFEIGRRMPVLSAARHILDRDIRLIKGDAFIGSVDQIFGIKTISKLQQSHLLDILYRKSALPVHLNIRECLIQY